MKPQPFYFNQPKKLLLGSLFCLAIAGCGQSSAPPPAAKSSPVATAKPQTAKAPVSNPVSVTFVKVSRDGALCAVGLSLWDVKRAISVRWLEVWGVKTAKCLYKKPETTYFSFLSRQRAVVTGDNIYLVVASNGSTIERLPPLIETNLFESTPDGKELFMTRRSEDGEDYFLETRNAFTGKIRQQIKLESPYGAYIREAAFSPDGKRVVTGAYDVTEGIMAYQMKPLRRLWISKGDMMGNLAWSPDGKFIAASVTDGIYIINARNGRLHQKLAANYDSPVRISADSRRLLFIQNRQAVVYDLRTGKKTPLPAIPVQEDDYISGAISDDGRLLAQWNKSRNQIQFQRLNW